MLPRRVWYYGRDEDLPSRTELRAGTLSLLFEGGDLRSLRMGEREVVRRIYVAIRDRNWGTVAPHLSNITEDVKKDSFRISFDVENREGEVYFTWKGLITGDSQGTVAFSMDGVAHSTFLKNRIGFCILHPDACAGARCRVLHTDGAIEESAFPQAIAPHQPFREIQAIEHEVASDMWAKLSMEGDVFEMEDQRNWTDASFKTYCTPLRLPFPAEIGAGTRVTQSVTLCVNAAAEKSRRASGRRVPAGASLAIDWSGPGKQLPPAGLGIASHSKALTAREVSLLRPLRVDHLRVDLDPAIPANLDALRRAGAEAGALGANLEIALHLTNEAERDLKGLAEVLPDVGCGVARWLVFHKGEPSTSERSVEMARKALAFRAPGAPFAGGSNAYFTELNRGRPPVFADAVVYSVNPQIHAFDNDSLMETLATQAATVESARRLSGGKAVIVSPVTLKPRFNAVATGPVAPPAPGELPDQVDVRQMSLFGAAWTLGSIACLARVDVASMTYYETTGWRGVMETEEGSPVPQKFPSLPGCVYPLYHVLADIGETKGGRGIPSGSRHPLRVEGVTIEANGQGRTLLANLTAMPSTVVIHGARRRGRVRFLDESNVERACREPAAYREDRREVRSARTGQLSLDLLPYATACIDWEE